MKKYKSHPKNRRIKKILTIKLKPLYKKNISKRYALKSLINLIYLYNLIPSSFS